MPLKPFSGEFEPLTLKPFDGEFEPLGPSARADTVGLLERYRRDFLAGIRRGIDSTQETIGDLMPNLADENSRAQIESTARGLGFEDTAHMEATQRANRMATSERRAQMIERPNVAVDEGMRAIGEAEGWWDSLKAIKDNPEAVGSTVASSLGMVAPGMVAGAVTGPAAPLVIGAQSGAIEYGSTIRDTLASEGVDLTDPSALTRALRDPELMARARERGVKRGVPIAAFDAVTAGVAGRLLAGARGITSAATRTAGELGVQAGGGMAGEALGQYAADDEVHSPSDVLMEGIAELPTGIPEAANNFRSARDSFNLRERVQGDYRGLSEQFDMEITSMQRGIINRGARERSQHPRGTAADFRTRGKSEEQITALMERGRALGYEVIDERNTDQPHIHMELPKGVTNIGHLPGTDGANFEERRRSRREKLASSEMTEGMAAAEDFLDTARKKRGMPLNVEAQTPKSAPGKSAPATPTPLDDLIAEQGEVTRKANDLTIPAPERREFKRQSQQLAEELRAQQEQTSRRVESAKEQLLDELTKPTEQAIAEVAPDAGRANAPQATQIEPQTPPTPPAPAEVAQPQPAAVAPPAQPVQAIAPPPQTEWQEIGRIAGTPVVEKMRHVLNRDVGLLTLLGNGTPTKLQPGSVFEVELEPGQREVLDRIGRILNRKIIPYALTQGNEKAIAGMAADDQHIFVNIAAAKAGKMSLVGLIGHEFTHTLRRQGSPQLEALLQFARQRINIENSYVREMASTYAQNYAGRFSNAEQYADTINEELLADVIGDILADERFWAELAQENPSLFKRTIKQFIAFLKSLADRAMRLGDDGAYFEIEQLRQHATRLLHDYINQTERQRAQPQPKPQGDVLIDGQSMREIAQLAPQGSVEWAVAISMLDAKGNPSKALRIIKDNAHAFDREDFAAIVDRLEQIEMLDREVPGFISKGDGSAPPMARTDEEEQALGEEVEYRRSLREGAQEARAADALERGDYMDAVQTAQRSAPVNRAPHLPIDTPEKVSFFANAAANFAQGNLASVLFHGTAGDITTPTTHQGRAFFLAKDADFAAPYAAQSAEYRSRRGMPQAMNMLPLVTNAAKPWDYQKPANVKKLVEALRDKFGSLAAFKDAMTQKHAFANWNEVADELSDSASNWTILEDEGAGVPALLQELGFDAYFVTEDNNRNLAVFDPRQIKSASGNVGAFGQRPPTAEEAASLGMTLEEALAAQGMGDIRLRLSTTLHNTFIAPLSSPTKGIRDFIERWLFDEYRDLKEIQDAIGQSMFGGQVPADFDAHGNENLRHGAFKDAADRAHDRFINPISRILSKGGYSKQEFSRYLWWRHASERDAYLRGKMDPQLAASTPADALAGIDPADAQANIAALDPRKRAAFERAAKFIDGMRAFTNKSLVDSGQISQAHYNAIRAQYQHYVPLRGMPDGSESLNAGMGGSRGLSMNPQALGKRALGRKSEPSNILEEMMRDMDNALVGVQKQAVLESLVRLIAANPDPDLWEISPVAAQRKWVNGVLTVVQTNGEPSDQITFMHRGMPVKIEIRHKGLREAMLNLNRPVPKGLRFVGRITRFLSAVKTSFSPFFLLVNPARDAELASAGLLAEKGMPYLEKMAEFYPHAYGVLMHDAARKVVPSNKPKVAKLQQYAREFASIGGKTGYTYVADIREQQRKLQHLLDRHAESKGMKDILAGNISTKDAGLLLRKFMQNTGHLFEVVNDMAENSTRLAVYAAMREMGNGVRESAKYAKEITVNFNRRGILARYLGPFYMFFNAAVQGGARHARLMTNKKFASMMGGLFAMSYTMAIAQMFAAGDDDDGESKYEKAISDAQAQRYLSLYVGNGKSISFPVAYGPNIFSYMGYRLAKMHYDIARGRETGPVAGDIAAQAMMSMSPIDPGKGALAFLPEVGRIPAQVMVNKNDFGSPISPQIDSHDRTGNPRFYDTAGGTGMPFRLAAEAISTATGGDKYQGGAINMTGEQVRYIYQQLGGGLARLATQSYEAAENRFAGIDPEPSDIPLANVYFRGKGEGRHATTYYNNIDDYENTVADWKQAIANGDERKIEEIYQHAPWVEGAELDAGSKLGREVQAGSVMEARRTIDRQMKSIKQRRNAIMADPNLSFTERKQALHALDLETASLQQDFNYAINAGRGYQPQPASR